jgi:hypothetical protein
MTMNRCLGSIARATLLAALIAGPLDALAQDVSIATDRDDRAVGAGRRLRSDRPEDREAPRERAQGFVAGRQRAGRDREYRAS